ncbi:unnamed protein product [Owenia fusiformis]|uniref:Netrin receptor UNC5 n=1 Tax=Owenia fusiformis TaxID=6347 RepID=A0A8J1XZ20_OWEFU|nr:unnamed protein product [Owenia fusiformis]
MLKSSGQKQDVVSRWIFTIIMINLLVVIEAAIVQDTDEVTTTTSKMEDEITKRTTTQFATVANGESSNQIETFIFAGACFLGGLILTALLALLIYMRNKRNRLVKKIIGKKIEHNSIDIANPYLGVTDLRKPSINTPDTVVSIPQNNRETITKQVILNSDNETKLPDVIQPETRKSLEHGIITTSTRKVIAAPVLILEDEYQQGSKRSRSIINQFTGYVGNRGGEIKSDESDVSVYVPKGAIPVGKQCKIKVSVSLDFTTYAGKLFKEYQNDIWLTPLVECTIEGVEKTTSPITIRVPHRVNIAGSSKWNMKLHYSSGELSESASWCAMSNSTKHIYTGVNFNHNGHYFNVMTTNSGSYLATGHGKKNITPLKLCTLVYGSIKKSGPLQANFRVYVCDVIKDSLKRISLAEKEKYSKLLSSQMPLNMKSGKDFEISLLTKDDSNWPWKLANGLPKKTFPLQFCYKASTALPYVEFVCAPKVSNSDLLDVQTTFRVSQKSSGQDDNNPTSIKVALKIKKLQTNNSPLDKVPTADEQWTIITTLHTQNVNTSELCRALGLSSASIEDIQSCVTDMGRTKRAIETWRIVYGHRATIAKLCASLENAEFYALADLIQQKFTFVDVPL